MLRSRLHAEFGDKSWRGAVLPGGFGALRRAGVTPVKLTYMKHLATMVGMVGAARVGSVWLHSGLPTASPSDLPPPSGTAAATANALSHPHSPGEATRMHAATPEPTSTVATTKTVADKIIGLGTMRVRVLRRGRPETGATVTMSTAGGRTVASGQSDERGEVQWPGLPGERYVLWARAADDAEARVLGDVFVGGCNTAILELSAATRLRIVAIDAVTKAPVAGAAVGCWMEVPIQGGCLAYTPLHPEAATRRTDAAGGIVFDGLLEGSTLRAIASDGPNLPIQPSPGLGQAVVMTQATQELRLYVQPPQVLRLPLAHEHEVAPPNGCDLTITNLSGAALGNARIVGDHLEVSAFEPGVPTHWIVRGPGCIAQALTYGSSAGSSFGDLAGPPVRFVHPRTCVLVLRDQLLRPVQGAVVHAHDESSCTLGSRRERANAEGTITWHDLPDAIVALRLGNSHEQWPLASVDLTKGDAHLEILLPTPHPMRADITLGGQPGLPADVALRCKNGAVTGFSADEHQGTLAFSLLWRDPSQPTELELSGFRGACAATVTIQPGARPAVVAFDLPCNAAAVARVTPPVDGIFELRLERRHDGTWSTWSHIVPGNHGGVLPPFTNLTPGCYRLHDVASGSPGPAVEVGAGQRVELELDLTSVVTAGGRVVTQDHGDLDGAAIVVIDDHGAEVRRHAAGPDGRFSLRAAINGRGLHLAAVRGTRRSAPLPWTGPLVDVVLALPPR